MDASAKPNAWDLSAPVGGAGAVLQIGALGLGAAFTAMLFLGIARYEKGSPARPPAAIEDLRLARFTVEPPPPPVKVQETQPDITPMAGFELSPAESPVRIAVSPPDLAAMLPEDLSKAPPANAQLGPMLTTFKPKMDLLNDPQHIYQKSELDRPVEVLDRPTPKVSSRVRDNAPVLRVTLVVVIEASGAVGLVRLTKSSGNSEFDAIMMESIKEWVFSAPMKNGKKVRCLIEQGITVQWSAGSHFSL